MNLARFVDSLLIPVFPPVLRRTGIGFRLRPVAVVEAPRLNLVLVVRTDQVEVGVGAGGGKGLDRQGAAVQFRRSEEHGAARGAPTPRRLLVPRGVASLRIQEMRRP